MTVRPPSLFLYISFPLFWVVVVVVGVGIVVVAAVVQCCDPGSCSCVGCSKCLVQLVAGRQRVAFFQGLSRVGFR